MEVADVLRLDMSARARESSSKQLTSMMDKGEKEGEGMCAGLAKKVRRPQRGPRVNFRADKRVV
jgi:hypothetical protein